MPLTAYRGRSGSVYRHEVCSRLTLLRVSTTSFDPKGRHSSCRGREAPVELPPVWQSPERATQRLARDSVSPFQGSFGLRFFSGALQPRQELCRPFGTKTMKRNKPHRISRIQFPRATLAHPRADTRCRWLGIYSEGVSAISRWLSRAIPPVSLVIGRCIPEGCQQARLGRLSCNSQGFSLVTVCHPSGISWPAGTLVRWWRCADHRLIAGTPSGSISRQGSTMGPALVDTCIGPPGLVSSTANNGTKTRRPRHPVNPDFLSARPPANPDYS